VQQPVPTPAPDAGPEVTLFEGNPAAIPSVGALALTILTLGLAALWLLLRASAVRYRVTNRRVVIERGLLSKRLEQTDVYRIQDYVVERPFGQRLLGTGNLVLHTMDTTAKVVLADLRTDVVALYEALRAAAESERARRGVRILEGA
jgi:uncharacterized membrane protein YdbT with pleckstrin-like domain